MSPYGASAWADLAVQLAWRLAATGAALAAGTIDLARARLIAEAASPLSDEAARAVEARVLPAAGGQTTGMLRAALRRAVIAADPAGAEERRKDAERRAQVVLYPDQDGTATLAGQRLPAVHATAAMARIKAMARALKASGAGGSIDLLSAQVYIGLLLGTLPVIPPPHGTPPGPPGGGPGDPAGPPGDPGSGPGGPPDDPGKEPRDGPWGGPDDDPGAGPAGDPGSGHRDHPGAGPADHPAADPAGSDPAGDVPPPGDQDAPRDDDPCPCPAAGPPGPGGYSDTDHDDDGWPAPDWPALPAVIPAAFTRPGSAPVPGGRPVTGLLDVSLPWPVLAGISAGPGYLGRIGPITAAQARHLAAAAARDPGTGWRIIVTTTSGHALTITRIPRPRPHDHPPRPGTRQEPGTAAGPGTRTGRTPGPGPAPR